MLRSRMKALRRKKKDEKRVSELNLKRKRTVLSEYNSAGVYDEIAKYGFGKVIYIRSK